MPTIPPTIDPSPAVPQRSIRATFGKLVDAFNTWKAASVPQFAAVATNTYNNAVEAFQSATAALNWSTLASDKAAEAAVSAAAALDSVATAAAINGAQAWVNGGTYQQFSCAVSKINYKTYRKITTAAVNSGGGTDPANDTVNWQITGVPTLTGSGRTANAILQTKDMGTVIDITGGTFTQTFSPAGILGAGWWCYISNTGTGDITLDPNGAETIDGLTSFVMYPGEARLIRCDGVSFRSMVLVAFSTVFSASAAFIKPPGYRAFSGYLWGGGGSGAVALGETVTHASGGGGAGCHAFTVLAQKLAASENVQIGAGAAGPTLTSVSGGTAGAIGGASTFAGMTANGGQGGKFGSSSQTGGTGGPSNNTAAVGTGALGGGTSGGVNSSAPGGAAYLGSGGGGGAWSPNLGQGNTNTLGGVSQYGGNGGTGLGTNTGGAAVVGGDGVVPGGGGGGLALRHTNQTSAVTGTAGSGANGEMRIWGVV